MQAGLEQGTPPQGSPTHPTLTLPSIMGLMYTSPGLVVSSLLGRVTRTPHLSLVGMGVWV